MPTAIPVTLIGGYLGAGKTTLVNHLLRERGERRIAVLGNDFGDLSIDDDLIESRDGTVLKLAGGCVCCSFGSDLMAALQQMRDMHPAPEHILIETSGVALPGAVARMLGLLAGLQLDTVLVLADADTLRERADDRYVGDLVRQQLAEADLVLLNKSDLVAPTALEAMQRWLLETTPHARVLPCRHSRIGAELLWDGGLAHASEPAPQRDGASRFRHIGMVATRLSTMDDATRLFASLSIEFAHAVNLPRLADALAAPSLRLLRAKGLMRDSDGRPMSLQLVGARHTLAESAHARPEVGRLVCIALRGALQGDHIRAALAACAAEPAAGPATASVA